MVKLYNARGGIGSARAVAAALVLAAVTAATASPELSDTSFIGKHIEISITYRYGNEVRDLYYESLLKNLDDLADSLKQTGRLSRGKVYFDIVLEGWTFGVRMYRYRNGYYCLLNEGDTDINITQDYMTKIITYFASDNWESFWYDDKKDFPDEGTRILGRKMARIFNRRIDTVTISHKYAARKVLDAGNGAEVYFQNDSLICKDADKVYGKISYMLPFSIGSKTFINIGRTVYVVENGTVINQVQTAETDFLFSGGSVYVFPKWINFRDYNGCFLSYSREKNKFYKINR